MGLDHLPPNHWARGRTRGNYAIASVLLAFAAGTYYHTMWRVQSTSELDVDAGTESLEPDAVRAIQELPRALTLRWRATMCRLRNLNKQNSARI